MPRAKSEQVPQQVPLSRYADRLIRDLHKRVPVAMDDWDERSIHSSRVSTRRLRAAIDLISPAVSDKLTSPLEKALRRIRKRLGVLRDFDVMLARLEPLSRHRKHSAAATWVRGRIEKQRAQARRKAKKKHAANLLYRLDSWIALREEINALGIAVEGLMIESLRSQWESFSTRADQLSVDLLDGLRDEQACDPHELRIAGKSLRYTFEMLDAAGLAPASVVRRTFKRMQNLLGEWHDCVVLHDWTLRLSLESSLALHEPVTQEKVLDLARFTLRKGERSLLRFASLWRENGQVLAGAVEGIVSESKTGPRPGGLFDTPVAEATPPDVSPAA